MTRPGQGGPLGRSRVPFFAERDGCYLVVHVPAAAEQGAQHGLVPEQGLDAQRGPGDPVGDGRFSPQGELLAGGADNLVGG